MGQLLTWDETEKGRGDPGVHYRCSEQLPAQLESIQAHELSGPLCTHSTKTGPFSLPSFLPSFPRSSRPSQLNGPLHYQPLRSPVTEATGGDRGSGHFSRGGDMGVGYICVCPSPAARLQGVVGVRSECQPGGETSLGLSFLACATPA